MARPDHPLSDELSYEADADDDAANEDALGWPRSGEEPLFERPLILDDAHQPLPLEAIEPCEDCGLHRAAQPGPVCPCARADERR